jgi:hypothetical protein
MSSPIDYAGEGSTDAVLARRLILEVGGTPGRDYVTGYRTRGKDALDRRIPGLLMAARLGRRMLVLRDLDAEPCVAMLVERLVTARTPTFCLRIAIRTAEAWLLADREGMAGALGIAASRLPCDPDAELDPKGVLRRIAAGAQNRSARGAFTGTAQQAQGWIAEFMQDMWSPSRARTRSASLDRALVRLEILARR